MALSAHSYPDTLDLLADDPRILRYLKGETIEHTEDEPLKKGWVLICVDGMALGWGQYCGWSAEKQILSRMADAVRG